MTTDTENDELSPLGEGPVAQVLAGTNAQTGESYALKVYPSRVDRHTRSELHRELSKLAALRGEGTILLPGEYSELRDGRFTVRMELCAQSLTGLVGSVGPLSIADTLSLGEALATALVAAHRAGIMHGGVTPGNVLFRKSGEPVLSDFGLVLREAFPRDPQHGVAFLAPETVRDGTTGERADLYGLGAILYFALSGRSPHQGRTGEQPGELTLRVLGGTATPLDRPDLPRGLAHLIASLLENNPDARPLDAPTVAARLGAFLGPDAQNSPRHDDQAFAFPPRLGEPIAYYGPKTKKSGPRKAVLLTAGGGLVVLAVATVLILQSNPEKLPGSDNPPPVSSAPPPTSTAAPASTAVARLDLDDPVDRGTVVELTWHGPDVQYIVVVQPEGKPTQSIYVQRATTYSLPVTPGDAKYCFAIQGTNGFDRYASPPKPIRGATCTR